jgi:hypothetical protein
VNGIEAERWAICAFATIGQILSHFVHGRTIATKGAGAFPVDPDMMVSRADRIAQVHDVEIAVHDHRWYGTLSGFDDWGLFCYGCHETFLKHEKTNAVLRPRSKTIGANRS